MFITKHKYSLINAFKAAFASLVGYVVGHYLGALLSVPQMYSWIVVTVLVVMATQPNLGGAVEKSIMRLLGTSISAVIAIAIIYTFENQLIILGLGLCLVFIGVFSAMTLPRYAYVGTLVAITISITMFGENISVSIAFYRSLEVIIGIIIALLVNRFILPIKAEEQLERTFSFAITEIHKLLHLMREGGEHEKILSDVFSNFSKQMALLKEVRYEKAKKNLKAYKQATYFIRQLYRYLCVIHEYIEAYPDKRQKYAGHHYFSNLYRNLDALLMALAESFLYRRALERETLNDAKKSLDDFVQNFKMDEQYRHSNTLAFALKSILEAIDQLIDVQEILYLNNSTDPSSYKGVRYK